MQLTQEKACRVAVGEGIEKLKADLKSLATVEEYIDYSLNPEWVAVRAAAALQYIEALEGDFKKIEAVKRYPYENKPCEVCLYRDCYCSNGGSSCRGFKYRGVTKKRME